MFKLPFKLSKKQTPTRFLTLDIGTSTIKCLAFEIESDANPETAQTVDSKAKIIGVGKSPVEHNAARAGAIIEQDKVAESIDNAVFKATQALEEEINDVIVGISGNLCTNLVTTVKINRASKKALSKKDLAKIDQKIVEAAYNKALEIITQTTGTPENNLEVITTAKVYSKVDGVLQENLLDTEGQQIEIATFTSFAPKYHLDTLRELSKLLQLNILAVTSNMYAVTSALKNGLSTPRLDAVILDIGSDITEVGVVFGGGIVAAKTQNVGGDHYTQQLSMDTGLDLVAAEKAKHDFSFETSQNEINTAIETSLTNINRIWVDGLELLFSEFNGVKTFASNIYLLGGGCKLPMVQESLETDPWTKAIPFKSPPEFSKISLSDLTHVHDITGEADELEFIVPAALSFVYLALQKMEEK